MYAFQLVIDTLVKIPQLSSAQEDDGEVEEKLLAANQIPTHPFWSHH
jgi:hypothetical protein